MTRPGFVAGIGLGALLGVALGWWLWHAPRAQPEHEAQGEAAPPAEPFVVELDAAGVARLGIATAKLQALALVPTLALPGRLLQDPAFATAVRAPLPGTLLPGPQPLPQVGEAVAAGAVVALLQPRLSATEQADLSQRRAQAAVDRDVAERAVDAAQRELQRLQTLHADGNAASQRAVDLAGVELTAQQGRLAAAQQLLRALPETGPLPLPLRAVRAGIVEAVARQPGEDVDAGGAVLQLGDPAHLQARVDVPAGADVDAAFAIASVELLDAPRHRVDAARVGWVDGSAGDRAVLLRLSSPSPELRAGLPLIAHLPRRGGERSGVLLPEAAVLRRGDGTWVYVRTAAAGGKTSFRRCAVTLDAPATGGWLSLPQSGAPAAGAELVVEGAAALLSVERQRAAAATEGG